MYNTIFRVIGNISSLALFLSPVPDIVRIHKKKSTEELHPYHYIVGILNCCSVVVHALQDHNSSMLLMINSIGFLLYMFYLITFLTNSTEKLKCKVIRVFSLAVIANVAAIMLILNYVENMATIAKMADIFFGIILTISLYASPLTVAFHVYKTKSAEFLPFWVGSAGFINGCVWATYGMTTSDFNLLVGNGVGALLSAFQLLLHVVYYGKEVVDSLNDHVKSPLLMEMV